MSVDINSNRNENRSDSAQAVYETPRLTVHGSLQTITANVGNDGNPDGPKGSKAGL